MEIKESYITNPFFSICIPQYNRTSYLIEALKVLCRQTFKDFEVCISDDRSSDGREQELIDFLKQSGLSFTYKKQQNNLRYDGNIRGSISLSSGRYCFLHGNDDCLASNDTLQQLFQQIETNNYPVVVITNFEDWQTGRKHQRIPATLLVGSGVEVAATHFRNVSFVTGVLIDRAMAQSYHTDKWDGSEMYQMFLMARAIASGGNLLELSESYIRKDIQILGESVDSYAAKPKLENCPIIERKLPLLKIGPLIVDAIEPYLSSENRNLIIESIFWQLYQFTYPLWIFEYRRIQSWNYALGICLGMKPDNTFMQLDFGIFNKIKLYTLYLIVCAGGLSIPLRLFDNLLPFLYKLSRKNNAAKINI
jgi:glycosyltransferase involved in cell wall biosynthesis